ncbi:hypothetical protein [Actomonas aquatica]|uniref:Uncharacterized protein n=1 Tax=Actomonas aquatica TaxID=2866162 RepID=A0ABZ1C3T4_9BACT|nr:hypothetical protein [Opitutus sp. WL0086]WRQ86166.1 hypothetical protein K1X11_015230 [Opitutus sp. WL0086]
MGFFDRLLGKSAKPSRPAPNGSSPTPPPAAPADPDPEPAPAPAADIGPVGPKLATALEQLEVRNTDGAKEIYEEILNSTAGDRPDVLVRISGDCGATGNIALIPELIAPRYDADRHGPATGINLLQAYLALGDPESAQHVLDLLFALQKPELEERLWGFSNAIGELMANRGSRGTTASPGNREHHINLVSISKPIWSYGLEDLPGLLPNKAGATKRVAFAQLSLLDTPDFEKRSEQPEEALGRFTRGLPLWLAETLYFSSQYTTIAAVGLKEQAHYALFPNAWTGDNIRQLIDTSGGPLDYVVTGALREQDGDFQLQLRLWEIKGFRERKSFEAQWTPATADAELAKLHQQLRFFFEWKEADGLPYAPPASATAWIDSLGTSLSTFLADKGVLPREQLAPLPAPLADPASGTAAALSTLTLADRASRLNSDAPALDALPTDDDTVAAARAHLGF